MDLNKVKSGDDLVIPAETYNAFVDAAVAFRQNSSGNKTNVNKSRTADAGTIYVQNDSGTDQDQFAVMAITEPVIIPSDDASTTEFKNGLALKVDVPEDGDQGRWCILQEPIADQGFGMAVVAGTTVCEANIIDVSHTTVEIADSNTTLQSSDKGTGQLIWVAGGVGTASAPGTQWVVIRIGVLRAIVDIRIKDDGTAIQVTYDGTNWVDKLDGSDCTT